MFTRIFHAWERRLVSVTKDRIVRPFEWGLEWIPRHECLPDAPPLSVMTAWASAALAKSPDLFEAPPTTTYRLDDAVLSFQSALATPHPENNIVYARYFEASPRDRSAGRRAVIVLPQWNADPGSHMALSRILARVGVSALRLSLPYHDRRMPPELHRADYIVSANVGRTLQACRQAVLDTRRAAAWLASRGYDRIGVLGTSLGSCLAILTLAHEPLITAAALNHISPFFADVVWHGLSTAHVRRGLEGHISLDDLRTIWMPISPFPYLERVRGKRVLLVYARYDLTFPVDLSRRLVDEFRRLEVPYRVNVLPCGHYSTGVAPFSWIDGAMLVTFLRRNL